mmetsp:Transcript_12166/g.36950  ORF Transcript_12166/g.36950 Transcript_12166/m.36950 type:complete len:285 (-) Transcript_12166:75-929(-)
MQRRRRDPVAGRGARPPGERWQPPHDLLLCRQQAAGRPGQAPGDPSRGQLSFQDLLCAEHAEKLQVPRQGGGREEVPFVRVLCVRGPRYVQVLRGQASGVRGGFRVRGLLPDVRLRPLPGRPGAPQAAQHDPQVPRARQDPDQEPAAVRGAAQEVRAGPAVRRGLPSGEGGGCGAVREGAGEEHGALRRERGVPSDGEAQAGRVQEAAEEGQAHPPGDEAGEGGAGAAAALRGRTDVAGLRVHPGRGGVHLREPDLPGARQGLRVPQVGDPGALQEGTLPSHEL